MPLMEHHVPSWLAANRRASPGSMAAPPVPHPARSVSRRRLLAAGAALGLRGMAGLIGAPPPLAPGWSSVWTERAALGLRAAPTRAWLSRPAGLALDPAGALLVADSGWHCVWRIDSQGQADIVVGGGVAGDAGDGGPASLALLNDCTGLALAPDGTLYIADTGNHRVRRVTPDGRITTVAGCGQRGFAGDGGPARQALLANPHGVAVGLDGAIFIADTGNDRIRSVDRDGRITTIAGQDALVGRGPEPEIVRYGGDGGPALEARLDRPADVVIGPDGALAIADTYNGRIRRVDREGIITTVAGGGKPGELGDDGTAVAAWLYLPHGVAVLPDGGLLIADSLNHRVRRVDAMGRITTIAGSGTRGFGGDDALALVASINLPWRVAAAPDGAVLVADRVNRRVRRIDTAGLITTVAGAEATRPETPDTPPCGGLYVTK